jgi:lipoprotein-anchoring transpeptidase ErfK/SrfK
VARGRHAAGALNRSSTIVAVGLVALVLLGGGSAYAAYRYDRASAVRILPGVTIEGVDAGNMTRDEAIAAVNARVETSLRSELVVKAAGRKWHVTPASLGTRADVEGAVDRAFAVADSVSLVSRVYHRVVQRPVSASIPLTLSYDKGLVRSFVQQVNSQVTKPALDAGLFLVNDELVVRKSSLGRELKEQAAASRLGAALKEQAHEVTMPMRILRPAVTVSNVGRTIVVDLSENMLYLYDGLKVFRQYPVATARAPYVTPVGTWKVVRKVENPGWYNPDPTGWGAGEPLYIPPGRGNPLGTRALYLDAPGIRIHGTPASYSIGTHASHGCIRMYISDSEELFPLVPLETKVIIKP